MQTAITLILTITIELFIATLLLSEWNNKIVLAIIALNFLTYPLGWFFVTNGASWWVVECVITFAESILLLYLFPQKKFAAFSAGIVMNICSAFVGFFWY